MPSGPAGRFDDWVSISLALSVDVLTDRAILIIALAVVALLAAGWRKPARASVRSPRGLLPGRPTNGRYGVPVDRQPLHPVGRTGIVRRLTAIASTGVIAVVTGTVIAVVVAFAAVLGVIRLTDLLGR
jgi:hypothetical protein